MLNDTIAAISTPPGEGGIGIVRVSGDDALKIAGQVFRWVKEGDWQEEGGYRLFYGHVIEPESNEIIDEVLLAVMRAPYSFTREDVIEFHGHGGIVPLRKILEVVLKMGARLAEPGEFARRAFINGRLDLAQAESIIDIIRAKTDEGLKLAVSQLKGELSKQINNLQQRLLAELARIEAHIDFPEELGEYPNEELKQIIEAMLLEINRLLASAEKGRIYREGILVVITGRPNVGKSSLLNALLREKRAIVTEIPGTTRDVIEEMVNLRGVPVKLADTAGLRDTRDPVEILGVEKSRELIDRADLVLVLIDAAQGVRGEDIEILKSVQDREGLVLVNKIDIAAGKEESVVHQLMLNGVKKKILKISVLTGEGLEELESSIVEMVLGGEVVPSDTLLVSNVRHKNSLQRAKKYLKEAIEEADFAPLDLLAIDIRGAWEALGEITGDKVTEDIVDRIFADFCVGK